MGKDYITPKGTRLFGEFPHVYNHPDYDDYAVAMNELASIWADLEMPMGLRSIPLINPVDFDASCNDRAFVFGYCSASIYLSNHLSHMGQLVRLLSKTTADEHYTGNIQQLLDKYAEILGYTKEELPRLFPEYLREATVRKAFKCLIRDFLLKMDKAVEASCIRYIETLDQIAPVTAKVIINFFSHMTYVRWVVARPDSALAVETESDRSLERLVQSFSQLANFGVIDRLRQMGKISSDNEAWLQTEGLSFFRGLTSIGSVRLYSVNHFLTALLENDPYPLVPVVTHLLDLKSMVSQATLDHDVLQNGFQALLTHFKEMAIFSIQEYSVFWTDSPKEKQTTKPALHLFRQKHWVQLPKICYSILSEDNVTSFDYHHFFDFFDNLGMRLQDAESQESFAQQMLYAELVKLYHVALHIVDQRIRTEPTMQYFFRKEYAMFFANTLHSVIHAFESKIHLRSKIVMLSQFVKALEYETIGGALDSIKVAKSIYFENKEHIVSVIKSLSFYADSERLKNLSVEQLFVVAEKFFSVSAIFKNNDRSENYFGLIFYKEIFLEISKNELTEETDFFLKILNQIKVQAKSFDYKNKNTVDLFLVRCIWTMSQLSSLQYKEKMLEIVEVILDNGYKKTDIQQEIKKFMRTGKESIGFSCPTDQYNFFIATLDRYETGLQSFCNARKAAIKNIETISLPGKLLELRVQGELSDIYTKEVSWSLYKKLLTSGKLSVRLSVAEKFLMDEKTVKEGLLLMTGILLGSIQLRDFVYVEEHIARWFGVLETLNILMFDKSKHYLWDTKMNTICWVVSQEVSEKYSDISPLIQSSVSLLRSFYQQGTMMLSDQKKELKESLDSLNGLFKVINQIAYEQSMLQEAVPITIPVKPSKTRMESPVTARAASPISVPVIERRLTPSLPVVTVVDRPCTPPSTQNFLWMNYAPEESAWTAVTAKEKKVGKKTDSRRERVKIISQPKLPIVSLPALLSKPISAPTVVASKPKSPITFIFQSEKRYDLDSVPMVAVEAKPDVAVPTTVVVETKLDVPVPTTVVVEVKPDVAVPTTVVVEVKPDVAVPTTVIVEAKPDPLAPIVDVHAAMLAKLTALEAEIRLLKEDQRRQTRLAAPPFRPSQPMSYPQQPPMMWMPPPPLPSQPVFVPGTDEGGRPCWIVQTAPQDPGMIYYIDPAHAPQWQ